MMRQSPRVAALVAAFALAPIARAQSALTFTLPFGPHTVGFKTAEQIDHSRTFADPIDGEGKMTTGDRGRPMQISIWYPSSAATSAPRVSYRSYAELAVSPGQLPSPSADGRRATVRRLLGGFRLDDTSGKGRREMDAPTHAVRDGDAERGSFPMVIYGPSFNAPSFENDVLMEYIASQGYIVVSSPSVGARGAMTGDLVGIETQARDMEYLIGYARTLPSADPSRVAVMGFSWGGISDVLVAMRYSGLRAVICLDGSVAYFYPLFKTNPHVDLARFDVPFLFMKQMQMPFDSAARANGVDSAFTFFDSIKYADAMLVTFQKMRHQNFGAMFAKFQTQPSRAFVADPVVASTGYERIARYALAFLDANVKDDPKARAFLARSPDENGIPAAEATVRRKIALRPAPTLASFIHESHEKGLAKSAELLAAVRAGDPAYALPEAEVNALGYRLLQEKRVADAVGVLEMNVALYPKSSNAYDSLAEAYAASGDSSRAIANYDKSLALDPNNTNAVTWLKKLRAK
ncbi:MAG: hypothetical protein M3081_11335 [Gemmatimonadota bacterium]|nr:hypothetical protein [Gemmatimonadota bacterium]